MTFTLLTRYSGCGFLRGFYMSRFGPVARYGLSNMIGAHQSGARRPKAHEEVAAKIQRLIQKTLKPGDKLPTQRTMATMFRATRGSVKDAVRRLELMGLVDPHSGKGTTVRKPSSAVFLTHAKLLEEHRQLLSELLDFRKILEPPLAARAAKKASREEVAEIESILQLQAEKVTRGELTIDEDTEFHYAIALASHNSTVLQLLNVLMDVLRESRERSLQVKGRAAKSLAGHRRIMSAIKSKNAGVAETAMLRHIEEIEAILLKQL